MADARLDVVTLDWDSMHRIMDALAERAQRLQRETMGSREDLAHDWVEKRTEASAIEVLAGELRRSSAVVVYAITLDD